MCTFTNTTRERTGYECRLKYAIQYLKKCMVQNPVAHRCFMDMSPLRVVYVKANICSMHVCLVFQIAVQLKDVLFEIFLKQQDVFFVPLATPKFIPCQKQVLWVDNCRK